METRVTGAKDILQGRREPRTTVLDRAEVQAWARRCGLQYAEVGFFPLVAKPLIEDIEDDRRRDARPVNRYAENLCSGLLPNGHPCFVGHHFHAVFLDGDDGGGWFEVVKTCVLARYPQGSRLVRSLKGLRPSSHGVVDYLDQYVADPWAPPPAVVWSFLPKRAPELVGGAVEEALAAGFGGFPERAVLRFDSGWISLCLNGIFTDGAVLDAMSTVVARLGAALEREAARHSVVEPGHGALPGPRDDDEVRDWLLKGAGRIHWAQPPPDTVTAAEAYVPVAGDRTPGDVGVGRKVLHQVMRLADGPRRRERADLWGDEAFAQAYARARGLREEDRDHVNLHLPLPIPGQPVRSFHGTVRTPAGTPCELRVLWWLDPHRPDGQPRELRLVVVPAPAGFVPSITEGFFDALEPRGPAVPDPETMIAGNWLVFADDITGHGTSAARLDWLIAQAVRTQ